MTLSSQDLAEQIDVASDKANEQALLDLIRECDRQLETITGEARVDLHYFRANAYAGIFKSKYNAECAWSWEQDEAVAELLSLRKAIAEPAFKETPTVRRFQIRTNLANRLSNLGRCVEAIEQWSLVLNDWPNFAMASGNRAYGIRSYAEHLYDYGHRGIFLKFASAGYSSALADDAFWDSGPDECARTVCVFRTKPAGDSRGNRPLETGFPEGWPISRKGGRFSGKAAGFPESVSRADGSDVGLLRYHDSFSEERSCRTKGSPCAKSKMSYA